MLSAFASAAKPRREAEIGRRCTSIEGRAVRAMIGRAIVGERCCGIQSGATPAGGWATGRALAPRGADATQRLWQRFRERVRERVSLKIEIVLKSV